MLLQDDIHVIKALSILARCMQCIEKISDKLLERFPNLVREELTLKFFILSEVTSSSPLY